MEPRIIFLVFSIFIEGVLVRSFMPPPNLYEQEHPRILLAESGKLNPTDTTEVAFLKGKIQELEEQLQKQEIKYGKKLAGREAENGLLRKLLKDEQADHKATRDNLTTCNIDKKTLKNDLALTIGRAAMEWYEKTFKVFINHTSFDHIEDSEERSRQIRILRWKKILKEQAHREDVKDILLKLKEASITADQFAVLMGDAYEEICDEVYSRIIQRAKGTPIDQDVMLRPKTSKAIGILVATFNFKTAYMQCHTKNENKSILLT